MERSLSVAQVLPSDEILIKKNITLRGSNNVIFEKTVYFHFVFTKTRARFHIRLPVFQH